MTETDASPAGCPSTGLEVFDAAGRRVERRKSHGVRPAVSMGMGFPSRGRQATFFFVSACFLTISSATDWGTCR
jgi:hypothetical protein